MAQPLERVLTVTRMRNGPVRVHVGDVEIIVFEYHEHLSNKEHKITLVIPAGIVNFEGPE